MMKSLLTCLALAFIASRVSGALVLSESGVARASIVIASDASEADRNAAQELKRHLDAVTGGDFPVIDNADSATLPNRIFVGASEAARKTAPAVPWGKLKGDDIVMQTTGDALVLAGSEPRGTLYAIYQFLQDVVGCDWWTSEASTIPHKANLTIDDLTVVYSPPFFYRDVFAKDIVQSPEFSVQMRRNGTTSGEPNVEMLPAKWGGSIQIAGSVHTLDKFLPAGEYFKEHPEWGPLIGGERRSWDQHTGQLCLSNPELTKKFTEIVLSKIEEYPDAKIISVSMNDNTYRCECDQCLAIEKEEGSMSGPTIRFVNAIAQEVAKKRPDMLVETLAYFYAMKPPQVTKPAKNVIIRFTTYTDDHRIPYEENPSVVSKLKSWEDISSQLFVWDYQPDFHDAWKPRPNILNMARNIRFFADHKVRGYFMEAEERPTDFTELRTWLACQLLWNPHADGDALIQRFLDGFYGAAGKLLFAYLHLMKDDLPAENASMTGFGKSRLPYRVETLNKASALFDAALANVQGDEVLTQRVKRARLALDYLRIYRYPEIESEEEKSRLFTDRERAKDSVNTLLANIKAAGIPANQPAGFGINPHDATTAAEFLEVRLPSINRPLAALAQAPGVVSFPAAQLDLWGYGSTVSLAPDPAAESGLTVRIPSTAESWSTQLDIPGSMAGKKWKVYIVARREGKTPGNLAVGLYNRSDYRTILVRSFNLKPSSRFQILALGEIDLHAMEYFYITPSTPFSKDGEFRIERIYMIEVNNSPEK